MYPRVRQPATNPFTGPVDPGYSNSYIDPRLQAWFQHVMGQFQNPQPAYTPMSQTPRDTGGAQRTSGTTQQPDNRAFLQSLFTRATMPRQIQRPTMAGFGMSQRPMFTLPMGSPGIIGPDLMTLLNGFVQGQPRSAGETQQPTTPRPQLQAQPTTDQQVAEAKKKQTSGKQATARGGMVPTY